MLSPFSVHRQSDYIYDESIIINGDGRIKVAMPMNGFQMIWNYRRTLGTHVRAPPNNTCLRLEWPLRNAWKWLARFPHEFRRLLLSAQLGTGLFCTKYKRKKKKFLSCALFYDGRHLLAGGSWFMEDRVPLAASVAAEWAAAAASQVSHFQCDYRLN